MRPDFDWQIDDDEGDGPWRPKARRRAPRATPRTFRPGRRWLLLIPVILALVTLPLGIVAWRARASQDEQRRAVLNLARLEDRLNTAGDAEALATLQDQQPQWRAWQAFFVNRDGTAPLNGLFTVDGPTQYDAVELEGDTASTLVTRMYRPPDVPSGSAPTFTLQLRQYYRLAETGWLRTAPPTGAAGDLNLVPTTFVHVIAPDADLAALQPIIARLDTVIARACADLGCLDGPPNVVITADLQDVLRLNVNPLASRRMIVYVPAPTLVGTPVDEAAGDALYRLYATRTVSAIALTVSAGRPGPIEPWLRWELARLGLTVPLAEGALRDTARTALLSGADPLADPATGDAAIWLALDFLGSTGDRAPFDALLRSGQVFSARTALSGALQADQRDWWNFLETTAALDVRDDDPAQLAVICNGQVVWWKLSTGALRPLDLPPARDVQWLPDGSALAVGTDQGDFLVVPETGEIRKDQRRPPAAPDPDVSRAKSPDRRYVASIDWLSSKPALQIYDQATGHTALAITRSLGVVYDMVWSPATAPGEPLLAVAGFIPGGHEPYGYMQVFDAQGRLVRDWIMEARPFDVQWAPDGTRFGWATLPDAAQFSEIFVTPLDGGTMARYAAEVHTDFNAAQWSAHWGWSPGGRWIVHDGPGTVVLTAAGKVAYDLPADCHAPVWRP
jgi:hypothetical protein